MSNSKSEAARWFAEEVQPHESSLRSYLRRVFPRLPDIDDLVQESYARLIRARAAGKVSFAKAFLFTTARNAALAFGPCARPWLVVDAANRNPLPP